MPIIAQRAISMNVNLRPLWTAIQEGLARTGTILQESFSGVRVVKAFAQEDYELRKYSKEATDLYEKMLKVGKIQAFVGPLNGLVFTCSTTIILFYGGREVILGHLTIGQLLQFYSYLGIVVWPVRQLGWLITLYTRGIASGERIFEILDTESAVKETPDAAELKDVKGVVMFEDVCFKYNAIQSPGAAGNVLDHVNIKARPGEMIALLGATGSGKTTVVNLIPRFYDVTSGRVSIDGIDIRDVTLTSLRRNVGIVQQDVFLFTGTVRDNISYGAVNATDEDIYRAARAAYLDDFIKSLPEGYDTWVGERGITLSGGQRQRLSIARTILLDPRILIFDDSTSSVDTETEYLIQRALRQLMVGRTSFVIAQRLQTVKDADRIYVLEHGKVVESGTHTQLISEGAVYPRIYELQLKDQEEAVSRQGVL
jgi:ATP-binding cassette subfamily B protein